MDKFSVLNFMLGIMLGILMWVALKLLLKEVNQNVKRLHSEIMAVRDDLKQMTTLVERIEGIVYRKDIYNQIKD